MMPEGSELIKGLKKGQMTAYKQLFVKYYDLICRFLDTIVPNRQISEDLAQNVFMKIWQRRAALDEHLSIRNYLYVLAKNAGIDYLRTNHLVEFGDEYDDIHDDDDANKYFQYYDTLSHVKTIVNNMPVQRKKIFIMSRYEKMPNKEIADALGLSVRTVEKHLELAMKDIKRSISS